MSAGSLFAELTMSEILKSYGFTELGSWGKSNHATVSHLKAECDFGINYCLVKEWHKKRNVVYAFMIDGLISYLGETTAGMASRFNGYRYGNPLATDTDNRVKLAITRALRAGCQVTIWAGQPLASLTLANGVPLEIPASKPLEEHLICILKPSLNVKNIGNSAV